MFLLKNWNSYMDLVEEQCLQWYALPIDGNTDAPKTLTYSLEFVISPQWMESCYEKHIAVVCELLFKLFSTLETTSSAWILADKGVPPTKIHHQLHYLLPGQKDIKMMNWEEEPVHVIKNKEDNHWVSQEKIGKLINGNWWFNQKQILSD